MIRAMSKGVRGAVVIIGLCIAVIFSNIADAETLPIIVGKTSSASAKSFSENHVVSTSRSMYVQLHVYCPTECSGKYGDWLILINSEPVEEVGQYYGVGTEHPTSISLGGYMVPPKGTYEVRHQGSVEGVLFESHTTLDSEVLPGPSGTTGAAGATGATGPAGEAGKEGATNVGFTTPAEGDLSEIKESMEIVAWCIIGTMLAIALAGALFIMFRPKR